MLRYALTVAALLSGPGAAVAQTPPATPPAPPASAVEAAPVPGPPPAARPTPRPHGGPGAWIRVRAPGGAEIAVRCAEGDSTRTCADIVSGLAEKLMAAGERRREAGRDMGREMSRGMMGRDREMDRGDMDERDGDRRERFRGEDRQRGWQ